MSERFSDGDAPGSTLWLEASIDQNRFAGELDWVRQMIDKFDTTARGTGAKIVNCCGHDSVRDPDTTL